MDFPDGKVDIGEVEKVCWWHMDDGRVLGVHEGQIVEYDDVRLRCRRTELQSCNHRDGVQLWGAEASLQIRGAGRWEHGA